MACCGRGSIYLHQMRRFGHAARDARCRRRCGRGRRSNGGRRPKYRIMSASANLTEIALLADKPPASDAKRAAAAASDERLVWQTPEQIPVHPLYTAADLAGLDHLDT